jgi:hypothetical protein
MQNARYESGLDNSPMYDTNGWRQPFKDGKMQLNDVGMSSMHAMDSHALADLCEIVGRVDDAQKMRARGDAMGTKIAHDLFDDVTGTFVNRWPNRSFYRRISPTSLYAMQSGAPSVAQAESSVTTQLTAKRGFCISVSNASTPFAGNDDDCYWGLPSIRADDPAFPALGYWRGYVWGPMAQLTHWALAHEKYAASTVVTKGRKALATQMDALFLSQYRAHRHVCENFSPHKDGAECTGMHYYHWGALSGFIGLLEAGLY